MKATILTLAPFAGADAKVTTLLDVKVKEVETPPTKAVTSSASR